MKTQEQQKADLLDELMGSVFYTKNEAGFPTQYDERNALRQLASALAKYVDLKDQKPISADPYADEIFKGKCGALIVNYAWYHLCHSGKKDKDLISVRFMRLSDMPHLHIFIEARNVGRKSIEYYKDVMGEYGFNDKLE